jgi:hypothetical protein
LARISNPLWYWPVRATVFCVSSNASILPSASDVFTAVLGRLNTRESDPDTAPANSAGEEAGKPARGASGPARNSSHDVDSSTAEEATVREREEPYMMRLRMSASKPVVKW